MNVGILICSFYLKKKYSRGQEKLLPLNEEYQFLDGMECEAFAQNCLDMFKVFCINHNQSTDDKKKQKLFSVLGSSVREYADDDYSALSFVIASGSYGIEGDITDRHTMEISHHRNQDEAEVKKFVCVIYIPKDTSDHLVKKGLMLFQSISNYGVKSITTYYMQKYFSGMGLTMETRSVSISAFIENLINRGNLYKLTLIRNKISPNMADNMILNSGKEERSFLRPTLQPEWLQKILMMFEMADKTGIYEFPEVEDFDDLSIQFKLGEKSRTVRLKNLDKVSIIEDVPKDIAQQNGTEKLIRYMIETAEAYKEKMVFSIG